jgi:hypothetical protein
MEGAEEASERARGRTSDQTGLGRYWSMRREGIGLANGMVYGMVWCGMMRRSREMSWRLRRSAGREVEDPRSRSRSRPSSASLQARHLPSVVLRGDAVLGEV